MSNEPSIDQRNAKALWQALAEMGKRVQALEEQRQILDKAYATTQDLYRKQTRVVGEALQRIHGSGSTEGGQGGGDD